MVLHAEHCHSLKEKRAVIRRLKDRVRARLDVTMAEVAAQDTWQKIVLGFAVVGGDRRHIEDTVDKVIALIEEAGEARLLAAERDTLPFRADQPLAEPPGVDGWIPPEWKDEL